MLTARRTTLSLLASLLMHALVVSGCEAPLPEAPRLRAAIAPVTVRASAPLEAVVVGRRLPKHQLQCGQELRARTSAARPSEPEARVRRERQHQVME